MAEQQQQQQRQQQQASISEDANFQQPLQLEQTNPEAVQEHVFKNRLQEFAQKAKIPYPVYQTINEGGPRQHPPRFRSTVVVDGQTFTNFNTFPTRRTAEQDVAKIALEGIAKRIKDCVSNKTSDEGFPPIYEDRVFCKSILHEYAVKANLERPKYDNVKLDGLVPVFVCSLKFNGATYTGEPSVTKKETERLAARAVILSFLGNSGAGTLLSEVIKSKAELFSAVHNRSIPGVDTNVSPIGLSSGSNNEASAIKESIPADANQAGNVIENSLQVACQGPSPDVPGHEFSKSTSETTESPTLPIVLSILGNFGAGTLLYEVIKSIAELFSAVHNRSIPGVDTNVSPIGLNSGSNNEASAIKESIPADANQAGNIIENALQVACQGPSPDVPGHEFRKSTSETTESPTLPIVFVPASQAQPTLQGLASGGKRNCKNKERKANKKVKAEENHCGGGHNISGSLG